MIFLTTLASAFYLLTGPAIANPSIEIIRQQHLETPEGRVAFLSDKLALYTAAADRLNHEIRALSEKIKPLSPQKDQQQILALTQEMIQKMDKLLTMMPVLNIALSVDEDFQQIDALLHQTDPLSPAQQRIVDRIASLCSSLETL